MFDGTKRKRASYFNASARTSEAYLGLMVRRPPFVKLPDAGAGVGRAMAGFQDDADMLGTTLTGYAKAGRVLVSLTTGGLFRIAAGGFLTEDWEHQLGGNRSRLP